MVGRKTMETYVAGQAKNVTLGDPKPRPLHSTEMEEGDHRAM
jgi:hypothetical protein